MVNPVQRFIPPQYGILSHDIVRAGARSERHPHAPTSLAVFRFGDRSDTFIDGLPTEGETTVWLHIDDSILGGRCPGTRGPVPMVDKNTGERQAHADSDAYDLFATYEEQTLRSRALHARATAVIPGGDTRSVSYHRTYPSFITEVKDTWLETADGERLVDFLNNYTQSVLGQRL